MCREHAGDGEGASKLLVCEVSGAPDLTIARAVSRSVVTSDLLKSAMFGEDANWGRILCAIGYTPGDFDVSRVDVRLHSQAGTVWCVRKTPPTIPSAKKKPPRCSKKKKSISWWT